MLCQKLGRAAKKGRPGLLNLESNANDEKNDRYRSWVVIIIWIIEKLLKKGG